MKNLRILKYVFLLFLGWKAALIIVTFFGLSLFPTTNPLTHQYFIPNNELDYWSRWGNWDGGHYRSIAENGYKIDQTVFFPLYPLLIRTFMLFGLSPLWSGLLISQISTITALVYLYKLANLEFGEKIAKRAVFVLLIFPTSFYLGTIYNESLFLSLTTAAIYYARTNNWMLAAILAGLSSVTRLIGIATILAIFVEYLLREPRRFSLRDLSKTFYRRLLVYSLISFFILKILWIIMRAFEDYHWVGVFDLLILINSWAILFTFSVTAVEFIIRNLNYKRLFSGQIFFLFLSLIPLPIYMIYQYLQFGSAISFLNSEVFWNKQLSAPWIGPLGYLNALPSLLFQIGSPVVLLSELLSFILLLTILILSFYKLKLTYVFFILIATLIPLLSGTLLDFPRYSLVIFPMYFILANINNEIIQKSGLILSATLLGVLSILFINSYWFM